MYDLNDNNYFQYIVNYYDNPSCNNLEEFYNDINYFKYVKRLVIKLYNNKEININILLNHLITLFNIFESNEKNSKHKIASRILFLRLDEKYWPILKSLLTFLNRCPDKIILRGEKIDIEKLQKDENLFKKLKK